MRNIWIIALVMCLISATAVGEQSREKSWEGFREEYGAHLTAEWNPKTGTPSRIRGLIDLADIMDVVGLRMPIGTMEDAQRIFEAFAEKHEAFLGAGPRNLRVRHLKERTLRHLGKLYIIEYEQTFKGIPVYGTGIHTVISGEGAILYSGATTHEVPELSVSPVLDDHSALEIASEELGIELAELQSQPHLVVYPWENGTSLDYRLVWHTHAWSPLNNASRLFLVDATDGSIFQSYDTIDSDMVTFWGEFDRRYSVDPPGKQSYDDYDEYLGPARWIQLNLTVDGYGHFNRYFQNSYTITENIPSSYNSAYIYAQSYSPSSKIVHYSPGPWSQIDLPPIPIDSSVIRYDIGYDLDSVPHNYPSMPRHFANVMWHCDSMRDFFSTISGGYTKSRNDVDVAWDHGNYVGTFNHIQLSEKGALRPGTVRHEYTHNVIWDVYGTPGGVGNGTPIEAEAMDEAFAFYYACRSQSDHWFDNLHNIDDPPSTPIYHNPDHYSQFDPNRSEHWNSWILSSAMWDVVKQSPWPSSWDEIMWLVLDATTHSRPTTFLQYRQDLEYWAQYWGGGYVNHVQTAFYAHGIGSAPAAPVNPMVFTDSQDMDGKMALLPNFPNPFNPETWIPYVLASDSQVAILIHNMSGELVRRLTLGEREAGAYTTKQRAAYWDGRNDVGEEVASGVYFYTLETTNFTHTRRMLVLR